MEENEILDLGFVKTEDQDWTEYNLGNICIIGTTLVEVHQNGEFITVSNCNTIEDLKQLIKLFL